jgi:hypothetical protein
MPPRRNVVTMNVLTIDNARKKFGAAVARSIAPASRIARARW